MKLLYLRWRNVLALLGTAPLLLACQNSPLPLDRGAIELSKAAPAVRHELCAGRLVVSGAGTLSVTDSMYDFYWGKVKSWRESDDDYAQRLRTTRDQARSAGKLIKGPYRFGQNGGVILVTEDGNESPFDPGQSVVLGYARHDGLSVEYNKPTVRRLQAVAESRAVEILDSVRPADSRLASGSGFRFCTGEAMLTLAPLKGWNEYAELSGTFAAKDRQYRFRFVSTPIRAVEHQLAALDVQRENLREVLKGTTLETGDEKFEWAAATGPAELAGTVRILRVTRPDGQSMPVLEWHHASALNDAARPAVYLYLWADGGVADAAAMRTIASNMPLSVRALDSIPIKAPSSAKRQQEESRVPYGPRLVYYKDKGNGGAAASTRFYEIRRNDEIVKAGCSDRNGFVQVQNANYGEKWSTSVIANSGKKGCPK